MIGGLLTLASAIGFGVYQEHERIDTEERQQLATQANVLDENLTRQLMSANAAIDAIGHDLSWQLAQQNGSFLVSRRVHALGDVMIGSRTLIVMNANGDAIASNQDVLVGQNFRAGQQFQTMRQGGDPKTLYVSPPFKTPLGTYAISVGKVIVDKAGRFDGVILATLDPEFFKSLVKSVRYANDVQASVIHGDGKMFFSTDETLDLINVDLSRQAGSFFNRHVKSGRELSIFSGHADTASEARLAALRTIGPGPTAMSKPLVIAVSRTLPAIYAQWRQQTLMKAGRLGLLTLLITLAMLFYQRRQRAFILVSKAKEAEQLQAAILAKSERFIRTITDAMPSLVAYWDLDLRCRFANKAYVSWFGRSPEQLIGTTIMDLMGAALFALNEPFIKGALAGEAQRFERVLTKADGSIGYTSANYIPDIGAHGEVMGFFVLVNDVTQYKETEAELKMAARVFECTSEGIMVTDAKGIILSVNPAFTDITGYSAQEAVGQTARLLRSHHHSQEFHAAVWKKIIDTGLWQGEIWNRRKTGEIFLEWKTITKIPGTRADEDRYVAVFHDITESWEKNESIRHLAFHDVLTNLPNRTLLMERIDRHIVFAGREARKLVVMFLDLDHFKEVNDRLGHAVGDDLLISVARKLQVLVRDTDTVARLGGDEFVIMLDNPASRIEVERVAERIITVINEPMVLQDRTAQVGASIGIAVYPADGASAAELIKSADLAMYEAKKGGRNHFRFYTPEP